MIGEYFQSTPGLDPKVQAELRRISEILATANQMPVLHKEPIRLIDGLTAICDGSDWDPLSDGVKRPVWYDQDAGLWKTFA